MMTSPSVDGAAEVRAALRDILREHGAAGLDDPKLVAQLLPDLLAASPREAKLILAATSAGVAGILRTRQAQGMTLQGAIRDAAVMLAQDSMIDAAMCDWIVTEFASSLGYPTTTTSMPETTSAPPAHVRSDPTYGAPRSDPTRIDRPPALPPTRVAAPPRYPPPYPTAPPYSAVPQSPPYGPPAPYPARPSYQIVPPPMIIRPVPPRRSGGTAVIVTFAVILVVVLCGGALWYAGTQAEKAGTKTFAQCLDGEWTAVTAQDSVRMNDGTVVPTTFSGGSIIRTFDNGTGTEDLDWTQATFTGTYKGRPVIVVYDGAGSWPYTTSGSGNTAYVAALAQTVTMQVSVTALGQTSNYDRITVPSTNARATCANTTLTLYDSDGAVHSTWAKRS